MKSNNHKDSCNCDWCRRLNGEKVPMADDIRRKISLSNTGWHQTEEAKRKMSLAQSGKPRMSRRKTILQLDKKTEEILQEYSGLCSVEAAGFNRYLVQNTCTRSREKGKPYNSQGYKWLYKD